MYRKKRKQIFIHYFIMYLHYQSNNLQMVSFSDTYYFQFITIQSDGSIELKIW